MKYLVALILFSLWQPSALARNGFDLTDSLVPESQIRSGGPPRDGIPALSHPVFETAEQASWLKDKDRVLALVMSGEARAYPIRILNWHELVNDQVGEQHFVVSYCPLCGTGMVFTSNIADTYLQFGVSGLLYNSDVLLYDRNSESLWSQLMGQAISGKLKGAKLPQYPVEHTTWKDWLTKHPDSKVLSRETGFRRNYKKDPYAGYEKTRKLYFSVSHRAPDAYHPKERVLGVEINGVFKAYPTSELSRQGKDRFEDTLGGKKITIIWQEQAQSGSVLNASGAVIPSVSSYWFAWFTFHPQTEIFKAPESS